MLRFVTVTSLLVLLALVVGFFGGMYWSNRNSTNLVKSQVDILTKSYDVQRVIVSGTVTEVKGNNLSLKNSSGQVYEFPLFSSFTVAKGNEASPSSKVSDIPLGKTASIVLTLFNNYLYITALNF